MDKSVKTLCHAIKKVIGQLKPQYNPLSFTVITGKRRQGITALLQQSQLHTHVFKEQNHPDLYYNEHGIILDLSEGFLQQSPHTLQYTLKKLNSAHPQLKITGLLLCIEINELCAMDPDVLLRQCKNQADWLDRFNRSMPSPIPTGIILTKMDHLTGFCEFFQQEHASELQKPLGFSLHKDDYTDQFNQFIDSLDQNMITRIHPVRSSLKRSLIREFPLQLASLSTNIQRLLARINPGSCHLNALYFTSAEQGGSLIDRLHEKIQHEYLLANPTHLPHSTNYRPYFTIGAILVFQKHTEQTPTQTHTPMRWIISILIGSSLLFLGWIAYQYMQSSQLLDQTSKELLAFDQLTHQSSQKAAAASYHLTQASLALDKLTSHTMTPSSIKKLHSKLHHMNKQQLQTHALPALLQELEHVITQANTSHLERYQALKIYLMFIEPNHFSAPAIITWYKHHWNTHPVNASKKLTLLEEILHQPLKNIGINQQIIKDARNYLNALPADYLYYSLAKNQLPAERIPVKVEGFTLSVSDIPVYFTKPGFEQIMKKMPDIAAQLTADNWVLQRQDLHDLTTTLENAYCFDYGLWWQQFMRTTKPAHVTTYQQAYDLCMKLHDTRAFEKLTELLFANTSAISGPHAHLFNRDVASQFTSLSLMSPSTMKNSTKNIWELSQFLKTLTMVNDQGKTAFQFTKSRFNGDGFANPLNTMYHQTAHLPLPMKAWTKQLADDTWFILINETRGYINHQWQQGPYKTYEQHISHRFPLDLHATDDIELNDFNEFFSPHGLFKSFFENYLQPFVDVSQAQWQLKATDGYVLPMSSDMINELMRANVITSMFFPNNQASSSIAFSLQKLSLDPVVLKLSLTLGDTHLTDTQTSDSITSFHWPLSGAKLTIASIEGNQYILEETGPWAFFKLLQKVNVLVDEENSAHLQILFEINGNSGRYQLKTNNEVNPFIPGILNGLTLSENIVLPQLTD